MNNFSENIQKPYKVVQDVAEIVDKITDFLANKDGMAYHDFVVIRTMSTVEFYSLGEKKLVWTDFAQIIDGYLTYQQIRGFKNPARIMFVVDEDGIPKRLALNTLVSQLFGVEFVGDVILVSEDVLNEQQYS